MSDTLIEHYGGWGICNDEGPSPILFRLRGGSPALALGFEPIDLTGVGPRVEVGPQSQEGNDR